MPIGGHDANTGTAGTGLPDTDGLAEGSTNLYFTNARVDTRHQTINTQGTYANRPAAAAANTGYFYYATDIGVTFRSTGSAWTVIADPWGFKFFEDEGFLLPTMLVEFAGLTTLPTESTQSLQAGDTWTIVDSVGEANNAGLSGVRSASWNLSGAASRILLVVGCHSTSAFSLFTANAIVTRALDDGYESVTSSADGHSIYRESAGLTLIKDTEGIDLTPDPSDQAHYAAILFNGVAGTITSFVRLGAGGWIQMASVADATFATQLLVGVDWGTANTFQRFFCPFFVFALVP